MASNDKKLFDQFKPLSKEAWTQRVIKDLRGADFDETLVWKSKEGFEIAPFYTKEDLTDDLAYLQAYQNAVLNKGDNYAGPRKWEYWQRIPVDDVKEANRKAVLALHHGGDGILFGSESPMTPAQLEAVLEGIELPYCSTAFVFEGNPTQFSQDFVAFLKKRKYDFADIKGSIIAGVEALPAPVLQTYFESIGQLPNFKGLTLKVAPAENLSATNAALLANAVKVVSTLSDAGADLAQVFGQVSFSTEADNNYFGEIARLRALRMLFHQIAKSYGVDAFQPSDLRIHSWSQIARDEETKEDPYLNMLSNTSQAMSAVIGGCDYLTILPHNDGLEPTDDFSDRIARNISNLLREESYFDKVADPAAGSFYIENLTDKIARKSWELFQQKV